MVTRTYHLDLTPAWGVLPIEPGAGILELRPVKKRPFSVRNPVVLLSIGEAKTPADDRVIRLIGERKFRIDLGDFALLRSPDFSAVEVVFTTVGGR